MSAVPTKLGAYTKVDVETASQGKLIVMLFNGAIKRAEEAKRQLARGSNEGVHNNLIRAQDIMGELRGALNMKVGSISRDLDRIYEYFQHLLITANIKKDPKPIEECVVLMTNIRDTWEQLFEDLAKDGKELKPAINQHGSSVLNLQG